MDKVRDFFANGIFKGELFTQDGWYKWTRIILIIFFVIWLLSCVYGLIEKYWVYREFPQFRRETDKFLNRVNKAVKHKKRKKSLLVVMPAVLLLIGAVILMLIGTEIITFGDSSVEPQLLFNIGFFAFIAAFIYGLVLYLKFGDLTGVGAALSYKLDYLPPQYVTETTYEKWDYEPDYAYKEVGSTTYDVNAGENAGRMAANIAMRIIGVICILFNSLWFLIKSVVQCAFMLIMLPFGIGSVKRAEKACRERIEEYAEGKIGEIGLNYNYRLSYHGQDPEHFLAEKIEAGQLSYLFLECLDGLTAEREPLLIVTYSGARGKTSELMCIKADKRICKFRVGSKFCHVYENARGRLFVVRDIMKNLNEAHVLQSYYIPFNKPDNWGIELLRYDNVRKEVDMLQYNYLKYLKENSNVNKTVRIMVMKKWFEKQREHRSPEMQSVALSDIVLDDKNSTFVIKR